MPYLTRCLIAVAAISIAIATGLGAYASHGLPTQLSSAAVDSFNTGVQYQFFHSLGLLGLAAIIARNPQSLSLRLAAYLIVIGIVLFCGGVYSSSLGGPSLISQTAPMGGSVLIVAWLIVAYGALRLMADRQN